MASSLSRVERAVSVSSTLGGGWDPAPAAGAAAAACSLGVGMLGLGLQQDQYA
jgi:hypothetical protein